MLSVKKESKKIKIEEELKTFQEKWAISYFFVEFKIKPISLICKESVMKECDIKRHYNTKHSKKFGYYTGQSRQGKVSELKRKLSCKQNVFMKVTSESTSFVKAIY